MWIFVRTARRALCTALFPKADILFLTGLAIFRASTRVVGKLSNTALSDTKRIGKVIAVQPIV